MMYKVYELFKDGAQFLRYQSRDKFDCEVWKDHHKYDMAIIKGLARLVIVEG